MQEMQACRRGRHAGDAGMQGILEEAGTQQALLCCQKAWLISSAPRGFSQDGRVFA